MTRITLDSGDDTIPLSAGYDDPDAILAITKDGIDGLFGTPKYKEDFTDIPQRDGVYWPTRLTQGARTITLECAARTASTIAATQLRDRINALWGKPLDIIIEDAAGRRRTAGVLADDPGHAMRWSEQGFEFSLVLYCPDPLLYGEPVIWRQYREGLIHVENAGTAPSYPILRSTAATAFDITMDGHRVSWSGAARPLVLDFTDMIPSQGTVRHDDAFRIPPGAWDLKVTQSGSPDISMEIAPAWR